MRIIKDEKIIPKHISVNTKYLSDDGIIFDSKYDCQKHEDTIKNNDFFKTIPYKKIALVDDFYSTVDAFYVKTKAEFEQLLVCLSNKNIDDRIYLYNYVTKDEGKFDGEDWYFFYTDYDYDRDYKSSEIIKFSDYKDLIKDFFKQFK